MSIYLQALYSIVIFSIIRKAVQKSAQSKGKGIMRLKRVLFLCLLCLAFSAVSIHAAMLDEYNFADIYYNGKLISSKACTIKGNVYIEIDTLEELGDCSAFEIDRDEAKIFIWPEKLDAQFGDSVTTAFIQKNAGRCYIPFKNIQGKAYVSLNLIQQLAKLSFKTNSAGKLLNTSYTDISRVDISSYKSNDIGKVRTENSQAAACLYSDNGENLTLTKESIAYILGETVSMYKIQTVEGRECYISKNDFSALQSGETIPDLLFVAGNKKHSNSKFNLVWQNISNSGVSPLPPDANEGIDVISPVWFSQEVNGDGNVNNNGDKGYVELAHERGFKVWATINNSMTTPGSTNYTTKVLADSTLRDKTIAQYLFYACLYGVDGINVDYEDLSSQDTAKIKTNFAAFVSRMSEYTNRLGLTLSVDVMVPKSWNLKLYDYSELAKAADYICVMSYDEHYSGSTYAGSVSSREFYTEAMEIALKYVPADKLVMGIPFYTRVWTVEENGRKISSYAASMKTARKIMDEKKLEPEWLVDIGQYYVEYTENGELKRIWLEDKRSIANRLSYVYYYKIAGSCCWAYGQQEDGILDVFKAIYKDGAAPGSFNDPY